VVALRGNSGALIQVGKKGIREENLTRKGAGFGLFGGQSPKM